MPRVHTVATCKPPAPTIETKQHVAQCEMHPVCSTSVPYRVGGLSGFVYYRVNCCAKDGVFALDH